MHEASPNPHRTLEDTQEAFKSTRNAPNYTAVKQAEQAVADEKKQTKHDAFDWERRMKVHMSGKEILDKLQDPNYNISEDEVNTLDLYDQQKADEEKRGLGPITEDDERYWEMTGEEEDTPTERVNKGDVGTGDDQVSTARKRRKGVNKPSAVGVFDALNIDNRDKKASHSGLKNNDKQQPSAMSQTIPTTGVEDNDIPSWINRGSVNRSEVVPEQIADKYRTIIESKSDDTTRLNDDSDKPKLSAVEGVRNVGTAYEVTGNEVVRTAGNNGQEINSQYLEIQTSARKILIDALKDGSLYESPESFRRALESAHKASAAGGVYNKIGNGGFLEQDKHGVMLDQLIKGRMSNGRKREAQYAAEHVAGLYGDPYQDRFSVEHDGAMKVLLDGIKENDLPYDVHQDGRYRFYYAPSEAIPAYLEQAQKLGVDIVSMLNAEDVDQQQVVELVAKQYQYLANSRPFEQINNSLFMNLVNGQLRAAGFDGVSHDSLDTISHHLQPKSFAAFFADYVQSEQQQEAAATQQRSRIVRTMSTELTALRLEESQEAVIYGADEDDQVNFETETEQQKPTRAKIKNRQSHSNEVGSEQDNEFEPLNAVPVEEIIEEDDGAPRFRVLGVLSAAKTSLQKGIRRAKDTALRSQTRTATRLSGSGQVESEDVVVKEESDNDSKVSENELVDLPDVYKDPQLDPEAVNLYENLDEVQRRHDVLMSDEDFADKTRELKIKAKVIADMSKGSPVVNYLTNRRADVVREIAELPANKDQLNQLYSEINTILPNRQV